MRSRKRTLQVNSIKKRDNMLVTYVTSDDGTTLEEPGDPITMTGNEIYGFVFCPSARDWADYDTVYGRRRSLVYARGYAERSVMENSNGTGWIWRRIVFATKHGFRREFPAGTLQLNISQHGQVRTAWNFLGGGTNANAAKDELEGMLFKGAAGADWVDRFSAQIDTTRVTVIKDRLRQLKSGNQAGSFHYSKDWYPVNKNIRYDEDENGLLANGEKDNSPWSTEGSVGVGNVYVYDIFACAGSDETSTMTWEPQGTWFWHER